MRKKKEKVVKPVGRPVLYDDDTRVYINATGETKLQVGSERRAIINALADHSGTMTFGELDKLFGYVIRDRLFALQRAGWLRIERLSEE